MTVSLTFFCLRFLKKKKMVSIHNQRKVLKKPSAWVVFATLPPKSTCIKKKFWDRCLSWKSSHLWFQPLCSLQANSSGLFLMARSTRKSFTSLNSLGRAGRLHCLGRKERGQNERGGSSAIFLSTTSLPYCLKYIFSSTQAKRRQSKLMAH